MPPNYDTRRFEPCVKRCSRRTNVHSGLPLREVARHRSEAWFSPPVNVKFRRCKCVLGLLLTKSSRSIASLIGGCTRLAKQHEALCKAHLNRHFTPVTILGSLQHQIHVHLGTTHIAVSYMLLAHLFFSHNLAVFVCNSIPSPKHLIPRIDDVVLNDERITSQSSDQMT